MKNAKTAGFADTAVSSIYVDWSTIRLVRLLNFKFSKAKYKETWAKDFKISFI